MNPSKRSLEEARKILYGCRLVNFCQCECHKTMSIPGSVVDAIALALDAKVLECAKVAESKWAMKRYFDSSDPDKWGNEYTNILEDKCDGWNKAKDKIAESIRALLSEEKS